MKPNWMGNFINWSLSTNRFLEFIKVHLPVDSNVMIEVQAEIEDSTIPI